jgi:tRNA(Ile)-lysidine synthase
VLSLVHTTIVRHGLIPAGGHVLAGISGGADSVAMLYALHHLRPRLTFALTAVHVHHGLRGAEADADAEFVQVLAWRLGVPCVVEKVKVAQRARREGVSVEMAGRRARHDIFARVARDVGADRVATAHHADDQVETILLRLLRGTGLQGLGGMAPCATVNGLCLIRPMMEVRHAAAVSFLETHGLAWREDASNRDTALLRNRVRGELLPFLEARFSPAVRANVLRTARAVREDQTWLDQMVAPRARAARASGGALHADVLLRQPAAARRRVLGAWLLEQGLPAERLDFAVWERCEAWLAGAAPRLSLPGGLHLVRTGRRLEVQRGVAEAAPEFVFEVPGPGVWNEPGWGMQVTATRTTGFARKREGRPGPGKFVAFVDEKRRGGEPLQVRTRRAGDRMRPFGLKGSVKVQDVLVDLKVPAALRDRLPVVTCGGEIVWLPGYRVARDWAVSGPAASSLRLDLSWS